MVIEGITVETYIGGKKVEEITPEVKRHITDLFLNAFGDRVRVVRREENKEEQKTEE
jgi:hypothetical protein